MLSVEQLGRMCKKYFILNLYLRTSGSDSIHILPKVSTWLTSGAVLRARRIVIFRRNQLLLSSSAPSVLHNPHSLLISINCQVCARTLWYWGDTDQWPGRCLLVTRGKLSIKKKWDLVQYSLYNSIRTFLLNKYMRIQLLAKFMNSFVCCDRITSQWHFLYRTSWATLFVVVVPLFPVVSGKSHLTPWTSVKILFCKSALNCSLSL